jgi:hypothetical protein
MLKHNKTSLLFIPPSSTTPPLPITGRQTAGCYAGILGDCDGNGLTAEHYISKNILKEIGNNFLLRGFPWLPPEGKEIGINSMTANILCKRHNNALSSLDTEAGKLFKCIKDIILETTKQKFYSFNGYDIERWLIKLFLGLLSSKNTTSGLEGITPSLPSTEIKIRLLKTLFSGPAPAGKENFAILYRQEERKKNDPLRISCPINTTTKNYDHVIAEFMFLGFVFSLEPISFGSNYQSCNRLHQITFNNAHTIRLFWNYTDTPSRTLHFQIKQNSKNN